MYSCPRKDENKKSLGETKKMRLFEVNFQGKKILFIVNQKVPDTDLSM